MDQFFKLRDRVENGAATPEERAAYYKLLASGRYDHLIEDDLDDALRSRQSPILEEARERIFDKIYSEHIAPNKTRRLRTVAWLTAAATVVTVSLVGVWLYQSHVNEEAILAQAWSTEPQVYRGRDFIRLPDGSTALLNEGSELTYVWGELVREVQLEGEAYFDIQHDPQRPFLVRTGHIVTKVLGTAFNVKAYPTDKEVRVTVSRGKVSVSDEGKTFGVIMPNQELAVNTETHDVSRTDKQAITALEWTSTILILDDVDMAEAAAIIGERYHAEIVFADEAIKSCGVSAKFLNDEKLTDVLDMIGAAVNISYTIENDTVTLSGKGCR